MKKRIFRPISMVLLLGLMACGKSATTQQVATYETMLVKRADTQVVSRFSASIQGRQDIQILPQVGGTIAQVCVKEGEQVRKGQTLFVIDQVPYKAALQTAEANVKAAEAGVATAQLAYDSRKTLFAKQVVSEYDLHLAENQLLTAQATLAQAEAQAVNARNSLGYTVVKAPADGVVGTIPFRVGALVGPSIPQPLTTVSDNSEMYVYFSMNEKQLLRLSRDHGSMEEVLKAFPKPELYLSDGSLYDQIGQIETISGVIDVNTGSLSLRAVFPNPGRLLHSGGSGNVQLTYKEKDCMVIPCIATYEVQDKIFVYQPIDGKAVSKMVEVSRYDGQHYIVRSGLREGDEIIVEGVAMLREGTPIQTKRINAEEQEAPETSTENPVTES
ncbi:MAG: efflux RND transporter periplasmic adaptor subunit [Alistipes sp.]|nr:efflux RND transporter periplasmic adaptor subunit [Alistipes sp.]